MNSNRWVFIIIGLITFVLFVLASVAFNWPTHMAGSARQPGFRFNDSRFSVAETPLSARETDKIMADPAALGRARQIYAANCTACHGIAGEGTNIAPPLDDPILRQTDPASLYATITNGRRGTPMPAWSGRLSQEEIAALVGLIRNWDGQSGVDSDQMIDQVPNLQEPDQGRPGRMRMGSGMHNSGMGGHHRRPGR